ncbi:DUF1295 domain-containing protein, partial [Clostridium perfringens]
MDIDKRYTPSKDKINDRGLWGWSRHPNYFFEWLVWLGFGLLAVDASLAWPWGFLAGGPVGPAARPACAEAHARPSRPALRLVQDR